MARRLNFQNALRGAAIAGGVLLAANASAATVSYANFDDNDGTGSGYDAVKTEAGAGGSNTLDLVIATDAQGNSLFVADGSEVTHDQLSFDVMAPSGFFITGFSVKEDVFTDTSTSGSVTGASLSIDVNGESFSLGSGVWTGGTVGMTKTVSNTGIINIANATKVDVSIDNNLFAGNGGTIEKKTSSITFEVAPVPLPPAVWLLGTALMGLVTVGRARAHKS